MHLKSFTLIKYILFYLYGQPILSDEDIIVTVIRKLQEHRFEDNQTIAFIIEQFSLLYKSTKTKMVFYFYASSCRITGKDFTGMLLSNVL